MQLLLPQATINIHLFHHQQLHFRITPSTALNPLQSNLRSGPHPSTHPPQTPATMAYYSQPQQSSYAPSAQNLQFFPSSYTQPVSGHSTPFQATYPGASSSAYGASSSAFPPGPSGVSGRMGEQGGLRTGWLAAFGTEGYEGEPPLLEELGVNFGHIKVKV